MILNCFNFITAQDFAYKILPDEENPTEERVKAFISERLRISF